MPGAKEIDWAAVPLPWTDQIVWPLRDGAEAVNVNSVESLGSAALTIVRKPLSGTTTQSE